jgi:murein DD-endopeptidase MepM/ murein hydrolase activator NlpD
MKILYILLLSVVLTNNTFAQIEKESYKQISTKLVSYLNQNQNDSIVLMFSPEMKKALPIDKFTEFTVSLKQQLGSINKIRFVRLRDKTALYETKFEKSIFGMSITLNNQNEIVGLNFTPYNEPNIIERNITKMYLPFKGEWDVSWGGDTKELNYHVESVAQKNAFDILIFDSNGSTHKGSGQNNNDYYAFGKELFSPCDGEVVLVVDGVKDNIPGTKNPIYIPGNTVIIKTDKNEYVLMAHFKQNSIIVKQGQKIKSGSLLGLCGNSGNSTEPHLHFHLQNTEDMIDATGIKCFFEQIKVNGILKTDYSPVKGEKIESSK